MRNRKVLYNSQDNVLDLKFEVSRVFFFCIIAKTSLTRKVFALIGRERNEDQGGTISFGLATN